MSGTYGIYEVNMFCTNVSKKKYWENVDVGG